ncbi:MAG: hypothetical protein Q7J57_15265 [Gemmobacter sp.]|nr:hypothetical protein [Gemmobacter sp.]
MGSICAAGLVLAFPVLPVVLGLCIALSVVAAVEVTRVGTRVSVIVLLAVVLFAVATERGSDVRMLALAILGLGGGYLVTAHLRMTSILRPPRANRAEAVRLAIFLSVGIALSIGLAMSINMPHASCLMPTGS